MCFSRDHQVCPTAAPGRSHFCKVSKYFGRFCFSRSRFLIFHPAKPRTKIHLIVDHMVDIAARSISCVQGQTLFSPLHLKRNRPMLEIVKFVTIPLACEAHSLVANTTRLSSPESVRKRFSSVEKAFELTEKQTRQNTEFAHKETLRKEELTRLILTAQNLRINRSGKNSTPSLCTNSSLSSPLFLRLVDHTRTLCSNPLRCNWHLLCQSSHKIPA